jgi:hypothetical protein
MFFSLENYVFTAYGGIKMTFQTKVLSPITFKMICVSEQLCISEKLLVVL